MPDMKVQPVSEDLEERVHALERVVNDILSLIAYGKPRKDKRNISAWTKAYRERERGIRIKKDLDEMVNEARKDPWLNLDTMTDQELEGTITQSCGYDECKNTRTLKLGDLKNLTLEEREAKHIYWCSSSCFERWKAMEDLLQDWPLYEAGKISEKEWDRRVKKARSAHLKILKVN